MNEDFDRMTPNAISNLLWLAFMIMMGVGLMLFGWGVNYALAVGIAIAGTPILWFALCLVLYWPRGRI